MTLFMGKSAGKPQAPIKCDIVCFGEYTLFLLIRTSNFAAEAEPFLFFSRFEPKMFLECSQVTWYRSSDRRTDINVTRKP